MKRFLYFALLVLTVGCDVAMDDDSKAIKVAEQWAEAYFNDDFHEAIKHATPDSEDWLRYAASNATNEDLQLLDATPATVTADDGFPIANDTLRVVTLHVNNYLENTALGSSAKQVKEGTFRVNVVKHDGEWLVKMEGLPQSERQSRD